MEHEAILIHGWNPNLYTSNLTPEECKNPGIGWANRPEFIHQLENQFKLQYYNLPGFCGSPEPTSPRFTVQQFADDFAEWKAQQSLPEVIVGYSFGGAVALDYKIRYQDPTPLVLISPAIYRGESARSDLGNKAKNFIPQSLQSQAKHLYQFIVSPYYRKGTRFLRASYDTIVRQDLREHLQKVDPNSIFLIYGLKDTDTPFKLVEETLNTSSLPFATIPDGEHNIGFSHPTEIVNLILNFLHQK